MPSHPKHDRAAAMNTIQRAVWFQPVEEFPKLKAAGVDTLLGMDLQGTITRAAWIAAAGLNGFKIVLDHAEGSTPDLLEEANPAVVGHLMRPDEPNGIGNKAPGDLLGTYSWWKQSGVKKLIHLSLEGPAIIWGRQFADYLTYVRCADVVWEDVYPEQYGQTLADKLLRIDLLKAACAYAGGGRQVMTVLECSDQLLDNQPFRKPPTPATILQQTDACLARGVAGVCWFTAAFTPKYRANGCNDLQWAAVKEANARIARYVPAAVVAPPSARPVINATVSAPGYAPGVVALVPNP